METTKFTLIHGTFSAKADWIHETDELNAQGFRALMKRRFANKEIQFDVPPAWGNQGLVPLKDLTNKARLEGAEQLKDHIKRDTEKQKHFMIAHSHGGNVAMYALQDKSVSEKIDGLICLATPFLYPRLRPLSVTALTLSLAIMAIGVMQFIWSLNLLESSWLSWLSSLAMMLFAIVIPAALIWLIAYERLLRTRKGDKRLSDLIDRLSYKDPQIPILLIRASGDEASGLLRGTQFLNWLGGVGMRLGGGQLYILVCAAALYLSWMAYKGSDMVPNFVFPALQKGLIISSAIMVVLLIALTISRIFVGFDAWRWVGEIETMVEDGPPGVPAELIVSRPSLSTLTLSHTHIYNQPETVEAIYKWCESIK